MTEIFQPVLDAIAAHPEWSGVIIFLIMLVHAFMRKERCADNPWGPYATTLEWTLSSPPPFHQFNTLPVIK